jgi:hypothetical protein
MLDRIKAELVRVAATDLEVALDDDFEPAAGTLLRVAREAAYWHLPPEQFLLLLRDLPSGAGSDKVHRAIESRATAVWHGPSPAGSRDTST